MTGKRARVLAIVALFAAALGPVAVLAASPTEIAAALAPEVIQAVSGGTWADGGKTGYYRAVLVAPPDASSGAQLFVQWVQAANGATAPSLLSAMPIKEFNDLKLIDASLSMEYQKSNEFMLYVEPNDPTKDAAQSFSVTATLPGKYSAVVGAPPE